MVFKRKSVEETDPTKVIERSFKSNGHDGRIIDFAALAIQTESTNDIGRLKEVHNSLVDNFYRPYKSMVKSGSFSADDINGMLNTMGRLWGLVSAFSRNPNVSAEVREKLVSMHESVRFEIEDAKAYYVAALTKSREEGMESIKAHNRELDSLGREASSLRMQLESLQRKGSLIEEARREEAKRVQQATEELMKLTRS